MSTPTDREREIETRARAAAERIAYEPAPVSEGEVDTMARIIAEEMAKLRDERLDTALEYTGHAAGCCADLGSKEQYPCKCGYSDWLKEIGK